MRRERIKVFLFPLVQSSKAAAQERLAAIVFSDKRTKCPSTASPDSKSVSLPHSLCRLKKKSTAACKIPRSQKILRHDFRVAGTFHQSQKR